MKRVLVLLLIVSMFAFVIAEEMPDAGIGAEDVQAIQGAIGNYSPLDESGNINYTKYAPFKTRAEERIDAINLWLEENASWLKVFFGMVPSITWLFAFNFYLLMFFFVNLVLNGNVFDLAISDRKFDLIFFEWTWGNILGATIFIVMDITKIIANLARFSYSTWEVLWNHILPWEMGIAVVIAIALGIAFVILLIYAPQVLIAIRKKIDKRKAKRAAEKEATDREALSNIVKGATGQS